MTAKQQETNSSKKIAYSEQSLVHCLARINRTTRRYIEEQLESQGIEGIVSSHGDILSQLFAHGPTRMSDLATAIDRDPSTVTALVRKLCKAGYITTQKNTDDHRITEVCLTSKGTQLKDGFQRISNELITIQMEGINKDDLAITLKTLATIEGNFVRALEEGSKKGDR